MRVFEVYEAVSKLGFEDSLEDNIAFYHALNRATVQINDLRPRTGAIEIFHKPLDNRIKDYTFTAREVFPNIEYSAVGAKAYYFEVIGEGAYKITYTKDGVEYTAVKKEFNTNAFTPKFGVIKTEEDKYPEGEVKLHIGGEYVIHVRNVALYDKLYGSKDEDVPAFTKWIPYDIPSLAGDFLLLEERPLTSESGITINDGYEIENGRVILLPRDNPGTYKIRYKTLVDAIKYKSSPTGDERVIPLDGDLCELLPLLIASYVWIDDEPDKAQYYLNLYTIRAREIISNNRNLTPLKYETNGW